MKKIIVCIAAVAATAVLNGADVGRVIVRQQWPWSTHINVDFELSGVSAAAPADITLRCYDGETEIPSEKVSAAVSGRRFAVAEGGTHTLHLDPAALFGEERKTVPDFKVVVSANETAAVDIEPIYMIVDLATGEKKKLCRADFYNYPEKYGTYETDFSVFGASTTLPSVFIWTGVTNNEEYVTTKLVLRRIPAAGAEWPFASASSKITAKLTQDFWIGVFELTQAQYYALKGSYDGYFTNEETYPKHKTYPMCGVAWRNLLDGTEALGILASRAGLTVNFPTELHWEYAAKGGAANATLGYSNVDRVAWYKKTTNESGHPEPVGRKYPNAFGLYDVLGNVREMCRDWYAGGCNTDIEAEFVEETGVTQSDSLAFLNTSTDGQAQKSVRGGFFNTANSAPPTVYLNQGSKYSGGNSYDGVRVWAVETP
jgi:formylglycine-generating enzyme required for sulfatase activity